MCGIFLCKTSSGNASEVVFEGLKNLEYRGYDSWGIASIESSGKLNLKRFVGKVSSGKITFDYSNLALGHTRWATHGKVTEHNSHPHISNNEKLVIVHNGIFENYLDYKDKLKKENYTFYSETDTEVLANLIQEEGAKKIFKKVKGENAFIALDIEKNEIFVGKKGSPLHIGMSQDEVYVSSDRNAIVECSEKIYSLKDGEVISFKELYKLPFERVVKPKQMIASLGQFSHYTLKEIFDQKESVKNGYVKNQTLVKVLKKNWHKGQNIFVSGCGTAYHAALMFSVLASEKGINARAIPANEMESVAKLIDKNTILFLFSQSGETADSILFAKLVIKNGGKVYSILNSFGSTLSQLSDMTFYIESGKEIAVASTKTFTGMIATSMKLLGYKVGKEEFEEIHNFITFDLKDQIHKIVKKYLDSKDLFVIGKGRENIIALETALKIKETSYIHAEGFAAGELKHGVLALIERGVLSIILSGEGKFEADMENAATQIKSRDGSVLGIGINNKPYYDDFIQIPNNQLTKNLNAVFTAIVGQIIAFEFATQKGLDPDKPRNLAKSVTVK